MRPGVVIFFTLCVSFAVWLPMYLQEQDLKEELEVAALIIVSTEHQRNEAWKEVDILRIALQEQIEQCEEGPPRLFRGPFPLPQQPQQNQEDRPPLSC